MENLQMSEVNFFLFLIPGFLMVWCFRKFTGREIKGDFEFAGLSIFLGLINIMIWELLSKQEVINKTLENVYSATFILCLFAVIFAYIGSWVVLQDEWKIVKNFLKPRSVQFLKRKK